VQSKRQQNIMLNGMGECGNSNRDHIGRLTVLIPRPQHALVIKGNRAALYKLIQMRMPVIWW